MIEGLFPNYCHCNEDRCGNSPPRRTNGSCPPPPGVWLSDAPGERSFQAAWLGILAMSVSFARIFEWELARVEEVVGHLWIQYQWDMGLFEGFKVEGCELQRAAMDIWMDT